jgi:DNA replication and repair protein RecF
MLTKLLLSNFRSYKEKLFEFSDHVTVIVGPNAAGKTNILEAISLLSTGTSFRADLSREMIREGEDLARVKGIVVSNTPKLHEHQQKTELEVLITTGIVQGRHAPYKKLIVDRLGRHVSTFIGNLPTVLFWPEDLALIIGNPSGRRRYLDRVLSQTDRNYRRAIGTYEKAIRVRNRLLKRIREGEHVEEDQMTYWNSVLIECAKIITPLRKTFLNFVNTIQIPEVQHLFFNVIYDHSVISYERLDKYFVEERAAGVTLVGPQRDDFYILMKEKTGKPKDLAHFGSRGEQRLGVLWLKLSELSYIEKSFGTRPLLLLDDIFSELDHTHRKLVTSILQSQQTIITTTDKKFITKDMLNLHIVAL